MNQRIFKKLLVEHGAPTSSDKRKINEGIKEMTWVAALKPDNVGVPVYRDTFREYIEISILSVDFRASAKPRSAAKASGRYVLIDRDQHP